MEELRKELPNKESAIHRGREARISVPGKEQGGLLSGARFSQRRLRRFL